MKEGASNCVERHLTIATLPFYGHILKWGISVVFIANALRRAPYASVRTCTCISLSIQNSILRLAVCILHPTSNGNSISESHLSSEYEGHAHHITSLRNYNYVIPRTKWRLERSTAPFQLYGGPTLDGTWP